MTWLRIVSSPLTWIATTLLVAWFAWGQMQRANAEAAERRAAERAAEQVGEFLTWEREQNIRLTDSIGELANVTGNTCVDSPGGVLLPQLLRRQRNP